jgi:hypothetical protein
MNIACVGYFFRGTTFAFMNELKVGRWCLIAMMAASRLVLAQAVPTDPALLNSDATTDGSSGDNHPQVVSDGAGTWMAIWTADGVTGTDTDIFVSTSTDNGATWSDLNLVNTHGTTDSTFDSFPRVTTDGGGNWVAVWQSGFNLGGTAGTDVDILVSTSTDNGVTWSAPALFNSNGTADTTEDDLNAQVTTDGAGNWVGTWYSEFDLGSTAGTDFDIFVSSSTDNGVTWSAATLLNSNGTTDSGDDRDQQVATDAAGNWVAVWYSIEDLGSTAGTDADIFVSTSTDNGGTWSSPALLNSNGTSDSGSDVDPQIATDAAGNWVAIWGSVEDLGGTAGTDADIFSSSSTDNGATWSGPVLVNANGNSDDYVDFRPRMATDKNGKWVAVWQNQNDIGLAFSIDDDIFLAKSGDNGATWLGPIFANTNGETDGFGSDTSPDIASDGADGWVVVWPSTTDLGGTAGTDRDVFVSTLFVGTPFTASPFAMPAAAPFGLALFATLLLLIGLRVMRRQG